MSHPHSAKAAEIDEQKNLAAEEGYEVVSKLYNAVSRGDVELVKALVASDIEWWFHGPREEQHLMRMLTGADRLGSISFRPSRLGCVHDKFLAEGFLATPSATKTYWVHVFTLKSGRIVELREYFKTSVTVTGTCGGGPLWQSQVSEDGSSSSVTSMPGLVVAV